MTALPFDPNHIAFDPIAGEKTWTDLNVTSWGTNKRARMDMNLLGQATAFVLAEVELMASQLLNQPPAFQNGIPIGVVLGERYPAVKAAARSPFRDAYLATYAWARWLPEQIEPANKVDVVWEPSLITKQKVAALAPIVWQLGAIGVALAAVAACAYWAGKREDAQASIQVESLRVGAALDGASKLAMAQAAAGQPIDPKLIDVFDHAGRAGEDARGWAMPVAAAGGGIVLGGGAVAGASKWK